MSTVQTRVDPVTAAVIAGALDSIAVEMGHKLARMAYSSIIRESEDFGCVLCDADGRQLCESSQSTPLQSGPIPGYIAGINRRFAELGLEWKPGRRRDPQPLLLRRLPSARRRVRRAGLLRERARRLLGDDCAPSRSRRADARKLRHRRRHRRLCRGPPVQRDQDRGGGPEERLHLADPSRQLPGAAARRRRHGGAGRGVQDRRRALRGADRALRPRDGQRTRART